jgi:hypothetical protein
LFLEVFELVKIKGSPEIEKTINEFLSESKIKFYRKVSGREEKALYIILDALGVYGAKSVSTIVGSSYTRINVDFFKALIGFKAILDSLLERGVSSIEPPNSLEFYNLFDCILASLNIAKYANLLNIQRSFQTNEAEIENGEVRDTREKAFYDAMQMWVDKASAEPDWENWYFDDYSRDGKSVNTLLEHEFRSLYKLELSDLKNISDYFEALSGDYIFQGSPTLPLKGRWEVQQAFIKNMDKKRATMWLKELEYAPGKSLFRSPLIPLVVSGKNVYYIAVWAFKPSNHFFNYWISEVLIQRDSEAAGVWGQKYGDSFERYLSFRLKEADSCALDLGSLAVTREQYPEIIPWLDKMKKQGGFQIDRVVARGDKVHLVSCKADFVLDRKLSVRDLFFPVEEFEKRCLKNIGDMNEINIEAECVRENFQVFDKQRMEAIQGKALLPTMVTSRTQPMAIPRIRSYYSKLKSVPDVRLFTAKEFVEHLKIE